jgi:hypothetical protein
MVIMNFFYQNQSKKMTKFKQSDHLIQNISCLAGYYHHLV